MKLNISLFLFLISLFSFSQHIAVVKYNGGGDWYSNPTALPNLASFCNENIDTKINEKLKTVNVGDIDRSYFAPTINQAYGWA